MIAFLFYSKSSADEILMPQLALVLVPRQPRLGRKLIYLKKVGIQRGSGVITLNRCSVRVASSDQAFFIRATQA